MGSKSHGTRPIAKREDQPSARQDFEIGVDSVAYGMDSITLVESVKQIVKEIKN